MVLEDSKILLNEAESIIKEIESLDLIDIQNGYSSPLLRVKIKQNLDNIYASLDYAAYAIFSAYCAECIPPKDLERKQRSVYFTIEKNESDFNKKIKRRFPRLIESQPNIVEVFKKHQPFFNKPQWLHYLKKLSNNNKHRYLSQSVKQTHTKINKLKVGDINITGGNFITKGSVDKVTLFSYNDTPLSLDNPSKLPDGVTFDGSVDDVFYFKEIDEPVLKTLDSIYHISLSIINELEFVLEGK